MKQVLSVADFSKILDLVNHRIMDMQKVWYGFDTDKKEYEKAKREKLEMLKQDPYYNSLIHLKESLENLNVEVETPNVEIKEK